MKPTPRRFLFESSMSTVQFNEGTVADDKYPSMFIQSIDAYGFQREVVVRFDKDKNEYSFHSYMHPYIRHIKFISRKEGEEILQAIVNLLEKTPNVWFDPAVTPRAKGFVMFHTRLLSGAIPSKKIL